MGFEDGLTLGTELQNGKYRILDVIGQGGYGITYKAKAKNVIQGSIGEMEVEVDIAIKEFFLRNECERDDIGRVTVPTRKKYDLVAELKQKFHKEALHISRLKHDNIVKVIDVFEENNTVYYVMQYIDGKSLDDCVKKDGVYSEKTALDLISQLSRAIEYIHKQRIMHLDIKPNNILIDNRGVVKLIDFGLSKHYDKAGKATTSFTSHGVSEGYSPIELYTHWGVREFSPQTDIFSLGATLSFLLTGENPVISSEQKLPELPSSISPSVQMGINAAMQPRKLDRPSSVGEFMSILNGRMTSHYLQKQNGATTSRIRTDLLDFSNKAKFLITKKKIISVSVFLVGLIVSFVLSLNNGESKHKGTTENTIVKSVRNRNETSIPNVKIESVNKKNFTSIKGDTFIYSGTTKNGKPEGKGEGEYMYGKYNGEFCNGIREGKGVYITNDGTNKFEGVFKNDEYYEGRLTFDDGYYYIGTFKNNEPYTGKWYRRDGKLYGEIIKGKDV